MSDDSTPNAEQVRYWSEDAGPRWVAMQERSDAMLRPVGLRAMEAADIASGERVLDVGAGCGDASLELAGRVGPSGHVHALDVSAPMLDVARARARAAGVANLSFQVGDAQVDPVEGAPYDLVFSRFGVMFFDDPPRAFAHLLAATRPGGRLAFACWRAREDNPWLAGTMRSVAGILEMPPAPDPHAPGPFGLFDRARTLDILSRAGWRDAVMEPFDAAMTLGASATLDEAVDFLVRLTPIETALRAAPPEAGARALDSLRACLRPYAGPEGVAMPGGAWIVTARRAESG